MIATAIVRPVLILPVYRGGDRFRRALHTMPEAAPWFERVVISVNSEPESADHRVALDAARSLPRCDVVLTGRELGWIEHQNFWVTQVEAMGYGRDTWIYWFAHDDELRPAGIRAIVDAHGNWPLRRGTIYLGPWAMAADDPDDLGRGVDQSVLDSWTSFPLPGPLRMTVAEWIADQLVQPTYINMSGAITTLETFLRMRDFPFTKPSGMRIEMAAAASLQNSYVEELSTPTIVTYGRADSFRTKFDAVARRDDAHLMAWLGRYVAAHPSSLPEITRALTSVTASHVRHRLFGAPLPTEEWRFREQVFST
jgi:hypothetical protein